MSSGSCYFPEEATAEANNAVPMTPTQKLVYAVERNDLEKVKEAISEGANINGGFMYARETPLLSAIYNNNVDIVKYLLSQKNTDINVKRLADTDYGRQEPLTPITMAIRYGRKDILDLLLRHGAKLDRHSAMFSTMAHGLQEQIQTEKAIVPEVSAKKKMFPGFAEMTRGYLATTPDAAAKKVFASIKNNNLNAVKNAIETQIENKGVTDPILQSRQFSDFILSKNADGDTFLIAAVRTGNIEIVKYLLNIIGRDIFTTSRIMDNRGVITNINNSYLNGINLNNAENALMVAALLGRMDMVNLLLDVDNINLNNRDSDGFSALDTVIGTGNLEVVKKMVNKGARLYDHREVGDNFPMAVSEAMNPQVPIEILKYLLEQGPMRNGLTRQYAEWLIQILPDTPREKIALLKQYIADNHSDSRAGGKSRSKKRRRGKKKMTRKAARRTRK
jgi:ankyrin repeat protein